MTSRLEQQELIERVLMEMLQEGEIAVPVSNDWNGVDLWMPHQAGIELDKDGHFLKEGVRIAIDDNIIRVFRFEPHGVAGEIAINFSGINGELLTHIIRGMVQAK